MFTGIGLVRRDFVKGIDTIIRKIFIPKDIRDEFEEEGD